MLIYLLRHGLTEYNAEKRYQGQRDIPLSAAGRALLCRADISPKTVFRWCVQSALPCRCKKQCLCPGTIHPYR